MTQSKDIERLGKRIRSMRERRTPLLWREICVRLKIFNLDESPATGLAEKIGYYEGYEPGREVRSRLGLRDQCSTCRRPFRKAGKVRPPIIISEARRAFNQLSRARQEEILQWALTQIGEL